MSEQRYATGPVYAVAKNDVLAVDTISSSIRATKVNAIIKLSGQIVMQYHTDQDIHHMFSIYCTDYTLVEVGIVHLKYVEVATP